MDLEFGGKHVSVLASSRGFSLRYAQRASTVTDSLIRCEDAFRLV